MSKSNFSYHYLAAICQITVIAVFYIDATDAYTGACYGTVSDNLPAAPEVVALYKKYNIKGMRLYNPNPLVLQALNTIPNNISLIVGVANEDINGIASNAAAAKSWVQNNILNYPKVHLKYIAVGNEISPSDESSSSIAPSVASAMQNIYNALSTSGLASVKVSTSLSMVVIGQSYPPSAGAFRTEFQANFIGPIVRFLVKTRSPLLMNIYPYFAYTGDTTNIHLDYALFTSPSTVVTDGQYQYQNLFSAMLDSVHAALEKVGGANVNVVVSESGWPSAGGIDTTVENARVYTSNLIKSVRNGTPRKPGKPIETYIFDLIDENQKSPEIEKHWGVFFPNKQPKYSLTFN